MTILFAKVSGGVGLLAGASGAVLAAIDTTTHAALIGVASLAITSLTAIVLAWIAYKQNALSKKQDAMAEVVSDVKKQTDGITSKIVEVTGRASHAEGELKGKADSQARQDAIDIGASARPAPPAGAAEPVTLKKIEKNTADTADNTAKTEATVQDLKEKQ